MSKFSRMVFALSTSQLPALLDMLGRELPRSFKVHGELKNHLLGKWPGMSYWVDTWPGPKVVLSKPQPGLTKSTYLDNILSLYCWDAEALSAMLRHPGLVEWSEQPMFAAVDEKWQDVVETEGKRSGCMLKEDDDVYIYTATDSSLKTYEVPPGLTLTSLREEHVATIVQKWRYSRPGVESYIQALVSAFPSQCLLDSTGRMVGCILGHQFEVIGMLMVDEDWRGKGLASLLLTSQAKQYPQPPISLTDASNIPAQRLHEKVGYSRITDFTVRWMKFVRAV